MIAASILGAFVSGLLLGALFQFMRVADFEIRCLQLQERNDRLVEAVSQSAANAPVVMPRQPVVAIEPSSGWWDQKRPSTPA